MRYINPTTRIKLNKIIIRLNQKELVTLAERIFLSKYLNRFPYLNKLINEKSLKFP